MGKGHRSLKGRNKSGMDTNLHAVSDNSRRPVHFFITAGQGRNHTDAAALKNRLPEAG